MSRRSPHRFGLGFADAATGLRFEGHHPQERPDLWARYVEGATVQYARYGVEAAFGRDEVEDGREVSVFFVGIDAEGEVVAGVRCHGPLDATEDSGALAEMRSSPEFDELYRAVDASRPFGVIEMKGFWSSVKGLGPHAVASVFCRCTLRALEWLRAEVALGAVAERLKGPIVETGGCMLGTHSVPYPSDEYRTVLMAWRRPEVAVHCGPGQADLVRREAWRTSLDPEDASAVWRPIAFEYGRRADRAVVSALRQDPAVRMIDRLAEQRAELETLRPPVPRELLEEAPRAVFYPWRQTLVKMVGPRAFERLRLDRNRNKITLEEQARLRQLRVGVVGLSVGHVVAHVLALEGLCGELRLADFDRIETSNLNRIPATVLDLGLSKSVVAARRIAELDPYVGVSICDDGVTADNVAEFVTGLDVVVEECDSIDVKVLVRETARRLRVPVLMETSDRGLFDVERFDLEPDRPMFHGLLPGVSAADMAGLPVADKVPYVLGILEPDQVSSRGAASMAEVGITLSTWPQLGGDVTLGAATVAAAIRRLGTGEALPSGRVRVDLGSVVGQATAPEVPAAAAVPSGDSAADGPGGLPPVPDDPDEAIAHAASLAPSGGNAQPWSFEIGADELRAYLVPERTSTMDVEFRGSFVAIGAAMLNARAAAAAQGRLGPVELAAGRPADPAAVLHFGAGDDPELASLYPQVLSRCANRQKGTPSPIDPATVERLARATAREGARLHLVVDRDQLEACADVLGESERLRFLSPHLHREMIGELRWPGKDSLEQGIDVRTLELAPAELATLSVARRADVMRHLDEWGLGAALGNNARGAARSASALAVVSVRGDTPSAYLSGGSAVERLWLTAEMSGLAVQPISPVFIYATDDRDFVTLVGDAHAGDLHTIAYQMRKLVGLEDDDQMALVMRLSHAPAASMRSLRLPLNHVFRRTGSNHSAPILQPAKYVHR